MVCDAMTDEAIFVAENVYRAGFAERFSKWGPAEEACKYWAKRIRKISDEGMAIGNQNGRHLSKPLVLPKRIQTSTLTAGTAGFRAVATPWLCCDHPGLPNGSHGTKHTKQISGSAILTVPDA